MSVIPKHGFKAADIIERGRTSRTNVEDIKKWLKFNPHIPEMSEEQIVIFLIACENILENTQSAIESYFKYNSSYPEVFSNRSIEYEDVHFAHQVTKFGYSPNRTKDNYLVGFAMLRDTCYYNYHMDPQVRLMMTSVELALYEGPADGLIVVINMKGVGIMHLTRLKISTVKKMIGFLQEGLPVQMRRIHMLNTSYAVEKLLAVVKPFMKKELFDLILTHSANVSMEEFFEKHVPANCLPSDFGGELPDMEQLSQNIQDQNRKMKTFLETEEKQWRLYKKENNNC